MDILQFEKEYGIHVYETRPDGRLTTSKENNRFKYIYSVVRSVDKNELCRIRIEWRDCSH